MLKTITVNKNRVLLYFSFDKWGDLKSRKHHLALHLANNNFFNKVLYIAPPIIKKKNEEVIDKFIDVSQKLDVYTPSFVSFKKDTLIGKYPLTDKVQQVILKEIKQWLYLQKKSKIIVWCQSPAYAHLLDDINYDSIIADFTDDYSFIEPKLADYFKQGDIKLTQKAEILFVVSADLYKLKSTLTDKHVFLLPNAVDFKFFNETALTTQNKPIKLACFNDPLIGYIGRMVKRLDKDLLKYIFKELPNYNFIFIGPEIESLNWAKKFSNFHYLGEIKYEELPKYIKYFSLCLLPHMINDFTKQLDPVKLYEYLSLGKPVVSTRVSGSERFSEVIAIASNYQEFLSLIKYEISNDNTVKQKVRMEMVKNNSWEKRVEFIINILNNYIY